MIDLYVRFSDYNFLENITAYAMDTPLIYVDGSGNDVNIDSYKFRLLLHYLRSVDMNLDVTMTTRPVERYIRILNLLNNQALAEYPILLYAVVDTIYKWLKTSQFEKPFIKARARSGSWNETIDDNAIDICSKDLILSDQTSQYKWHSLFRPWFSFNVEFGTFEFGQMKKPTDPIKHDIFLSIILGKILVKFKDIKLQFASIDNDETAQNTKIKEDIFEAIDWHTTITEIIRLSKGEALFEIPAIDFYEFFPFIDQYQEDDDSVQNNNEQNILSFIETLFPVLTFDSQVDLLESGFENHMSILELGEIREFLSTLKWPYFTLKFIEKKVLENIKSEIDKRKDINPFFELMYCFEDFLVGDFINEHLASDHVCINQERHKNLFSSTAEEGKISCW